MTIQNAIVTTGAVVAGNEITERLRRKEREQQNHADVQRHTDLIHNQHVMFEKLTVASETVEDLRARLASIEQDSALGRHAVEQLERQRVQAEQERLQAEKERLAIARKLWEASPEGQAELAQQEIERKRRERAQRDRERLQDIEDAKLEREERRLYRIQLKREKQEQEWEAQRKIQQRKLSAFRERTANLPSKRSERLNMLLAKDKWQLDDIWMFLIDIQKQLIVADHDKYSTVDYEVMNKEGNEGLICDSVEHLQQVFDQCTGVVSPRPLTVDFVRDHHIIPEQFDESVDEREVVVTQKPSTPDAQPYEISPTAQKCAELLGAIFGAAVLLCVIFY